MRYLRQLGNHFSISIPPDENGYVGRECPDCERYFKITPGTGITGSNLPCHCPYCGHCAESDQFFTKAQLEYAKSVVVNQVTEAFIKDLKTLEFNIRPSGFMPGISMKVSGRADPIESYSELQLEEEVVCDNCSLRYTIYGTFAFCPDCGRHNSRQILEKNLALARKQIDIAGRVDADMGQQLIADALENGVSGFDGFGREACRVHASKAPEPAKAAVASFQNLSGARKHVQQWFGIDLAAALSADEWPIACQGFQKRHLFAHKMGIVDDAYIKATGDRNATVGRKVPIRAEEVVSLIDYIRVLGLHLASELEKKP